MNKNTPASVALWRRLAAIFYDVLVLGAVLFFASAVVVATLGGKAVAAGNPFFALYLIIVSYAYFGYCWVRGGQTLGMRTWNIRLLNRDNDRCISWRQSLIRFCTAIGSWLILGIGFLAALTDADERTWHDRLSCSRLVRV
jgi:uncharacterized RDD family membrane protein YckC